MSKSLTQYQDNIREIYFETNKLTVSRIPAVREILNCNIKGKAKENVINIFTGIWLQKRLNESVENISKRIDRNMISKEDIISFWGWFFSYANMYNIDVFECVTKKYPMICYYCLSAPCVCQKYGKKPNPNNKLYARYTIKERNEEREQYYHSTFKNEYLNGEREQNFSFFNKILEKVYPNNEVSWRYTQAKEHLLKISEELYELVRAGDIYTGLNNNESHMNRVEDFNKEFADLTLWMVSLWRNLFPDCDLDIEFYNYYYKGCNVCKSKPCKCIEIHNRTTYSADDARELILSAKQDGFANEDDRVYANSIIVCLQKAIDTNSNVDIDHYCFKLDELLSKMDLRV